MRPVSNVTTASHTWAASIDKLNEMAYLFSTVAVTVEANSIGAATTGNAHIIGNFSATLIAADSFRGGNVSSAANLTISSNLIASSNAWFNGALVTVGSNVVVNGATTTVNALSTVGLATLSTVNVTSTAELRGVTTLFANVIPTSNAAVIQVGRSTGRVLVFANTIDATGAITTTANVNGASGIFTGNVTVSGDANVAGNLNVTGTLTFIGTSSSDFTPTANITYYLGNTTKMWLGMHTKGLLANSTDTIFRTNRVDLPASTNTIATARITPSAVGGVGSLTAANGDIWVNATNSTYQELQVHIAGAVQNVAFKSSTVNAATQLETTRYIKLTGDATGSATFNGTANADITVTVGTIGSANNSAYLGGQLPAYYTDIAARLGYTAFNKAGETAVGASTFAGNITPTTNTVNFGNTTQRWIIFANTINVQGTSQLTGVATFSANIVAQQQLLVTNAAVLSNTLGVTGAVTFSNTLNVTGTITGTLAGTANNADFFNGQSSAFYANATNITSGTLPEARLTQANATTNGIMRVLDSVTNTSILIAASANSAKNAYDRASTMAATAYTNAVSYADSLRTTAQTVSAVWSYSSNINLTADMLLNNNSVTPVANSVGYRLLPQLNKDVAYTVAANDAGFSIVHTNSNTSQIVYTIANNSTVPIVNGTTFVIAVGYTSNTCTIVGGSGVTIRLTGTATTGTRTIAKGGLATCYKFSTDEWWVSGPGVT